MVLNNKRLRELGAEIDFYKGLLVFIDELKHFVKAEPAYRKHDIRVEHYIVSKGLRHRQTAQASGLNET